MRSAYVALPLLSVLAACGQSGEEVRSYGNDALPSAEVTAFQQVDARLRYRNARIGYDANGCATYEGVMPSGAMGGEPLRDAAGQPICTRR